MTIWSHFLTVYIGRKRGRNGRRDASTYSVGDWNVHERTVQGAHRTNNACEDHHNAMASCLGAPHPTLYKLIKQLKKEENMARKKVMEANLGKQRFKEKRIYSNREDRAKSRPFLRLQ